MVWAFGRENEQMRCEVRRETNGDAYEFVITRPDGTVDVERFDEPTALIERSVGYLDRLRREGWQPIPLDVPIP